MYNIYILNYMIIMYTIYISYKIYDIYKYIFYILNYMIIIYSILYIKLYDYLLCRVFFVTKVTFGRD